MLTLAVVLQYGWNMGFGFYKMHVKASTETTARKATSLVQGNRKIFRPGGEANQYVHRLLGVKKCCKGILEVFDVFEVCEVRSQTSKTLKP